LDETFRWILVLDRLGANVQHIEESLDDFEISSPGQLVAGLRPRIERLSEDVRKAVTEICDGYDAVAGVGGKIGDLAFCALVELRPRQERFSRAAACHSGLALEAEAGSLLRSLHRALMAVQGALCEYVGLRPTLSLARELALALKVRAVYAEFRREIEAIAAACRPEEGGAGAALHSAATSIADLMKRDVFRQLRFQDRHQLGALQERILAWRVETAPDPAAARQLWQDLYGCTQLLQEINHRQELVEYDRSALVEA
jgi:hypothetical protein